MERKISLSGRQSVKLLLDTHVAIWATSAPDRIPAQVRGLILGADQHYVSMASYWEIAIKAASGRTSNLPMNVDEAMAEFSLAGFQTLDIVFAHVSAVASLRLDHADPFDRLILAQALTVPLTLVTHDRRLAAYSTTIISW